jgi:hypothetical protein
MKQGLAFWIDMYTFQHLPQSPFRAALAAIAPRQRTNASDGVDGFTSCGIIWYLAGLTDPPSPPVLPNQSPPANAINLQWAPVCAL